MTILLSIPNTLSTRNLLRTGVLARLKAEADRVVLVAPFADEPEFQDEFVRDNVVARPMPPYRPGRGEHALFSALYNLYLAGPSPRSLQLFLDRWADNHPSVGGFRRGVTRHVLPWLRPLTPVLEWLFVHSGQVADYETLIARERPDVAVFSRLFFCDEIPLMRACVRAGVRTVGAVASWDNLTTKGPLLPALDQLIVWNELMRDEAVAYHGYAPTEVAVTGAPQYDMLHTAREQLADRLTFFARLGLDPAKKLITYAGEDPIIAPDAPRFAAEIHRALQDGSIRQPAQLLVRPHPQDDPRHFDPVRHLPGVVFDLPGRPSDRHWMDMSLADMRRLYETMWHSDVIVNVTSTIVVDAAFFDTPSVCVGYGYSHPKTHFNEPMRFFEMDHYRYVMAAGATEVVDSPGALVAAINGALETPGRLSAGRRRIAREIGQFEDGASADRLAAAIIAAARADRTGAGSRSTVATAAPGRAI